MRTTPVENKERNKRRRAVNQSYLKAMDKNTHNHAARNAGRILKYGASGFRRNIWLSIAATLVMTITLLILCATAFASSVLSSTAQSMREKIDIAIYFKPGTDAETLEELKAIGADAMFTCAYGQLLTKEVLSVFPLGVWNAHASLLPLHRGASPVQSAILAGERTTGVTIMKTELALDSGDILLVKRCGIADGETCGELSERLSALSAEALCEAADMIERGDTNLLLQDESAATFCKKIKKEDAKVDFGAPASKVCALINAMSPSPAAHCSMHGSQINLYRAYVAEDCGGKCGEVADVSKKGIIIKCGEGAVRVTEAQFAGGKRLSAADISNGRKLSAGDIPAAMELASSQTVAVSGSFTHLGEARKWIEKEQWRP